NSTGLFELAMKNSELLAPFEDLGVETTWEFRMERAANKINYDTIDDVLIAIDYTALASADYRKRVTGSLGRVARGERAYSVRYDFTDQWYELHNPEQSQTPMSVSFATTKEDFPANVGDVRIRQVLVYFSRREGSDFEVEIDRFSFTEEGAVGT